MKKEADFECEAQRLLFGKETLAVGRGSWDEAPYAVAKKYIDNCYTIGYNSNTWFGYVLYPLIYHAVSATNPIVC